MNNELLKRRGILFVISSPSGAGKTSICRGVLARNPSLHLSVSVTTRPPRPNEINGDHYHFVDMLTFQKLVGTDAFVEHAEVFGNFYGTPKEQVLQAVSTGVDTLFDIDWQGMQQIKTTLPNDVVGIFILPPSIEELQRRLRTRAQDSLEVIQKRMEKATEEMRHWVEYNYVIVNEDLEESINAVTQIIMAEKNRRERYPKMYDFVRTLSMKPFDAN